MISTPSKTGKARFLFWGADTSDPVKAIPFFKVIENRMELMNGFTVSGIVLLQAYGIPLPLFPSYETWQSETRGKRRCSFCWAITRNIKDRANHLEKQHKIKGSEL